MKIYIAQQNYVIGDFKLNSAKIIEAIQRAKKQKADIVVFSEMSVCGYPAQDLLLSESFIHNCHQTVHLIKKYSRNIGVIIGAPEKAMEDGETKIYDAAYFLYNGDIQSIIRKLDAATLRNHQASDDSGNDTHGQATIVFKEKKLAIIIGEMWDKRRSPVSSDIYTERLKNADITINISASRFDYTATGFKKEFLKQLAFESGTPVIYCNAAGAQGGVILEGKSMVFDAGGYPGPSLKPFEEDEVMAILSDDGMCQTGAVEQMGILTDESFDIEVYSPSHNIVQIRKALVCGIKDYFNKLGVKKAIVGNSGGIDSAVTLALAVEALGKKNVIALMMPSQYSSKGSVSDGEHLCKNLGVNYNIIPIKSVFSQFTRSLTPVFNDLPEDLTEENLQARIRGNLLMAVANKFNYILLNTSNKSELSVGYGTMYGDLCGGLSVLGDCYKMQIYELAKNINQLKEIIPQNILDKAPSAELHAGQLDADSLPEYHILDKILYQYIDLNKPAEEIIKSGFARKTVARVINLINKNEFKRHQFCPILGISALTFGTGRRMPVVAKYAD